MDKPEPLTFDETCRLVKMLDDLKAENARLRSEQPLLSVLREIAIDPSIPPHIRLRAAEAGVQYETPRLSATMSHMHLNIGERYERATGRVTKRAEELGLVTIEGG